MKKVYYETMQKVEAFQELLLGNKSPLHLENIDEFHKDEDYSPLLQVSDELNNRQSGKTGMIYFFKRRYIRAVYAEESEWERKRTRIRK